MQFKLIVSLDCDFDLHSSAMKMLQLFQLCKCTMKACLIPLVRKIFGPFFILAEEICNPASVSESKELL